MKAHPKNEKKRNPTLALFLIGGLALATAACGSSSASDRSAPPGHSSSNHTQNDLSKITVLAGSDFNPFATNIQAVPFVRGYYKKAGLDVTYQPTKGAIESVQSLLGGQGQFGEVGTSAAFSGYAKDKNLKLIAVHSSDYRMIVPANSSIKSVKNLKGMAIGAQSLASSSYQFGRAIVSLAGLNPDKDVKWLPVGIGAQAVHALQSHQIAAYVTYNGPGELVAGLVKHGVRTLDTPVNDLVATGGYVTTAKFAKKHPKQVVSFLEAVFKGAIFAYTNPKAGIQDEWKQHPQTKPKDMTPAKFKQTMKSVKSFMGSFANVGPKGDVGGAYNGELGITSKKNVQHLANFYAKFGITESKVDVSKLVDFSFAKKANKAIDIDKVIAAAKAAG
jgi:NitT/TauT family transport system substrate-binding protein